MPTKTKKPAARTRTKKVPGDHRTIPVTEIKRDLDINPRFQLPGVDPKEVAKREFAGAEFKALCANLDAHGIQQPLLVRQLKDGSYELLEGWRRSEWAIRKNAKLKTPLKVPVIVVDIADEQEAFVQRIAMNTARSGYDAVTRGYLFKQVLDLHKGNMTLASKQLGVSRQSISKAVGLLEAPEELLHAYSRGEMTLSALQVVFTLPGFDAASKPETKRTKKEKEDARRFHDAVSLISEELSEDKVLNERVMQRLLSDDADAKIQERTARGSRKATVSDDGEVDGEDDLTDALVLSAPKAETINAVMRTYGARLATEILRAKPDPKKIKQFRERIEMIGVAIGACVTPDLTNIFEEHGENTLSESSALALCEQCVREYAALGYLDVMEKKGKTLSKDNKLNTDEGWSTFVRTDMTVEEAVQAIAKLVK